MCLITNDFTQYIAKEDIVVYKGLIEYSTRHASAIHFSYIYEIDKEYTTDIIEIFENIQISNNITLEELKDYIGSEPFTNHTMKEIFESNVTLRAFGPGFHSNRSPRVLWGDIYECIIPKGAIYYKGFGGDIISNKIKIVKQINKYETQETAEV